MDNWKSGELLQDKRSKELYIFLGTATEEDHRKYRHPVDLVFDHKERMYSDDWLLWSNKQSKFIFMSKKVSHLYLQQLDTATTNDTEIN